MEKTVRSWAWAWAWGSSTTALVGSRWRKVFDYDSKSYQQPQPQPQPQPQQQQHNNNGERRDGSSSQQSRSPPTVPEVITSPAISAVRMPSSPSEAHANLFAARSSAGSSSNGVSVDFVPFVQRRVSTHHLATARLSAVRPTIEPVKLGSTTELGLGLGRPTSPTRRNSRGEPLSPSAWMAGFGLGSNPNVVDPFTNPSYVSSSGGSHRGSYQSAFSGERDRERPFESGGDLASPRSGAQSLASDRTPRGRHSPIQYQQMTRGAPLSIVAEHGPAADVRPDGASDIMSTFGSAFGDRPESTHSHATSYNEYHHHPDQIQLTRYHALSDVEEVLTPVADERLSLRPGQEAPWRAVYESRASIPSPRQFPETVSSSPNSPYFSHLRSAADNTDTTTATATQFRNPFASDEHVQIPQHSSPPPQQQQQQYQQPRTPQRQHHHHQSSDADLANAAAMIPPVPSSGRNRRPPGPHRRKSEATSLSGILPSDASVAPSMTGTSIVERPHSLDTSEWDDPSLRRQQEERLFFSGSIASTPSENK
ncbi:hypothetical protein FRC19_003367 [Serendipita sp. 401]|nr:hypothetical protein FRC19_003367 [Serendipita sp. 401]